MINTRVKAIEWEGGRLKLLDQRLLPQQEIYLHIDDVQSVFDAIRDMVVRGAPAIGIVAAYGVVLSARAHCSDQRQDSEDASWSEKIGKDIEFLRQSRPTAINLFWALDCMSGLLSKLHRENAERQLLTMASQIHQDDWDANRVMGGLGAELIANSDTRRTAVLTHCNAGALATGGYGTALGVIRSGVEQGVITKVYADETRPWLQGARLTAWELSQDNIPCYLLADSAASHMMKQGEIGWVIVGSDRIAANGDVANKIGTYQLAIAARYHGIKFMVVAPTSTIDLAVASGVQIPIEQRHSDEIVTFSGANIAPPEVSAVNPVFDVTPAELVDAIVTEKGVVESPCFEGIAALFS
ncbi:MAG: S-methyl-5-thioribose-1-phosphate isomerase [Pseudomonadales bacterium]|nr:S-methyl-5-thioribose-1-phosphate isomerase [Pseudomonadales bacterium]